MRTQPIDARLAEPVAGVHVVPRPTSSWTVHADDEHEAVSEHASATEAERAAHAYARIRGAGFVILHDRYSRVHVTRVT